MQSIINFILLRFSINARITTFRFLERLYSKFVYKNLITYAFYLFKYKLFLKFCEL